MSEQHGPLTAGSTLLGVPSIPQRSTIIDDGPVRFTAGHHFDLATDAVLDDLVDSMTVPLSVILQVTKRCNFDCSFCSEILQLPDPTLYQLDQMRVNLAGVRRVFLSGGEPLMRQDFGDVVDMFGEFIIGVPTNATRGLTHAARMAGRVAYVNVGLEGPRAITNRVRGDYDQVMAGIRAFQDVGLPLSLSAVVYRSTLAGLPYLGQIADVLDAGKVKLIMPLRKGNALDLDEAEFLTNEEAGQAFDRLTELRTLHLWRPALRMTTWTPQTDRAASVNVAITGEPARVSPFIEDVVLRGIGDFSVDAEVDLFGAQLTTQLRAARHHALLIADKTICNVLAYSRLVLDLTDPPTAGVLDAMTAFAAAWAPLAYDVVFYLPDQFNEAQPGDAMRTRVAGLQDHTAEAVRTECRAAGVDLVDVPAGLLVEQRVTFITTYLRDHGRPFASLP